MLSQIRYPPPPYISTCKWKSTKKFITYISTNKSLHENGGGSLTISGGKNNEGLLHADLFFQTFSSRTFRPRPFVIRTFHHRTFRSRTFRRQTFRRWTFGGRTFRGWLFCRCRIHIGIPNAESKKMEFQILLKFLLFLSFPSEKEKQNLLSEDENF
jgi:hypothetical protein